MRPRKLVLRILVFPLLIATMSVMSLAQGPIGSATVTGPVRIDGQNVTGSVQVMNAARLSTGDNASVNLALAQGGQVMLAGQADVIVTHGSTGPLVQLICGEVSTASTVPATIVSTNGARVFAKEGKAVVTAGGKVTTVKEGKSKDFDGTISVAVAGPGSTAVVTSRIKCNCNCGGRP